MEETPVKILVDFIKGQRKFQKALIEKLEECQEPAWTPGRGA